MRNKIMRGILKLELHELMSILMILFIEALYRIGLPDHRSGVITVIRNTVANGSPITKLYVCLLVGFAVATFFWPRGGVKNWATFILRMMSFFTTILFSFEAMTYYIHLRGLELKDSLLQHWDSLLLFGKQAAEWLEPWNNNALVYFLSAVYVAWLIFLYGTVLLLSVRGKQAVVGYMTAVLLTHFIGHSLYILVPVIGPMYTFDFTTPMGGITAKFTNGSLSLHADAFPSLHTAVSIVMAVQIWRSYRVFSWFYIPFACAVIFATIYLRIHYVVDVIAGIALAIAVTAATPYLLRAWSRLCKISRAEPLVQLSRAPSNRNRVYFLRKFLLSPRQIGSITPSSQRLVHKVMAPFDWDRIRSVIELGAGTGVFTNEIAERIAPDCQVAVFEKDDDMRRVLQDNLTDFHYFRDAQKLSHTIRNLGWKHADCIISSLPFANFKDREREAIMRQIKRCLHDEGTFVCYQYSLQMKPLLRSHFQNVTIGFVAWNAPPAFVYVCTHPVRTEKKFARNGQRMLSHRAGL